jgi:hypothetical protein
VERAAEGACLRIASEGVVYELLGAIEGLVVGQEGTVAGHVDRTVATVCGVGVPFVVTRVETPKTGS